MDFYETKMGHIFFEHQVPQLINTLNTLAGALSKSVPQVVLPVTADTQFLRDLFFGDYEPEVFKVSPELQQLNRTVDQAHKSLVDTLSEDSIKHLEGYETALSERSIAVMEQAYKAGIHAAVQMILAGLSYPSVGQDRETEAGHEP